MEAWGNPGFSGYPLQEEASLDPMRLREENKGNRKEATEKQAEGEESILEKRMRSPLSPDFNRKNGKNQRNTGTTAIGRTIRARSDNFFNGLIVSELIFQGGDVMLQFRSLIVDKQDEDVEAAVQTMEEAKLPEGDLLIRVAYSSINYKDALALEPDGRIVSRYPLIPGIDAAGVVEKSSERRLPPGTKVIVTGHGFGVSSMAGIPNTPAYRRSGRCRCRRGSPRAKQWLSGQRD
ncbi:hypothetical protein BN871_DW_00210 [Paenibacillus sp. P22]|nr:hypothetical protein BN871_DW_00210 [Paenibacillus sp. P22]